MWKAAVWILLGSRLAAALAEFFVPGDPPYPRWTTGETQKISYKTTYTEYTIAIWQQFDDDKSADLGPILFQTSNGPGQDFEWLVQSYQFNLERSNKFFLWLFEGDTSAQGNSSFDNQSSGYFYISEASTTTEASTASAPTSTDTSSSTPAASSSDPATTDSPFIDDPSPPDEGLSTGAKAGIGAGAGAAALAIIAAIILFLRYRSKNKKRMEELQSTNNMNQYYASDPSWSYMSKTTLSPPYGVHPPSHELPGQWDDSRERAELG